MIPHNRTLVERLKGEPFALVGVDTDRDKDSYHKQIKEHKITWRNSWQGSTSGPLCEAFRVQAYPTVFLLDHEGVIREKWVGAPEGEVVDKAVDDLVAKAKKAQKK